MILNEWIGNIKDGCITFFCETMVVVRIPDLSAVVGGLTYSLGVNDHILFPLATLMPLIYKSRFFFNKKWDSKTFECCWQLRVFGPNICKLMSYVNILKQYRQSIFAFFCRYLETFFYENLSHDTKNKVVIIWFTDFDHSIGSFIPFLLEVMGHNWILLYFPSGQSHGSWLKCVLFCTGLCFVYWLFFLKWILYWGAFKTFTGIVIIRW